MSKKYLLKDELFSIPKVVCVAKEIGAVYDSFEVEAFITEVINLFPQLELKERMYHMSSVLRIYLPSSYVEAVDILLQSLPIELDSTLRDDDFGDFIYATYSEFVVAYGCSDEYVELSLQALLEMTKRFSVEYAIRDFINHYPKETLSLLTTTLTSTHYHQRRLVSEGLRPKLPWAKGIDIDYRVAIPYLDKLHSDQTRYVTRSVANHLNNISKIDAPLVIETLQRWRVMGSQEPKEMEYITRHALRTLVKQGDRKALELLGYERYPAIAMSGFSLSTDTVMVGESLVFELTIEARSGVRLMVDYIIYFRTKLGALSPKVYKLKKLQLKKGEIVILKKQHLFRANMSTRALYKGAYRLELQVNGVVVESGLFDLVV